MATDNKYDRQLRLWGAQGQKRLSESSVLLVNADGVGTETLKNLVLPGVGKITILDENTVAMEDLGSNFFFTVDSIGQPRAGVATQYLCELNPDVVGEAVQGHLADYVNNASFLQSFNIVVAANLSDDVLLPLGATLERLNIPLVAARAYGLIGVVRLQYKNHEVIESKPDASKPDLRIHSPWPELVAYIDEFELDTMDTHTHSHVPYIVILHKALVKWRVEHQGASPRSFEEKEAFKSTYVRALANDVSEEINFQEALTQAYLAYTDNALPYEVEALLEASKTETVATSFQAMVAALRVFRQNNDNHVPLAGDLPDMTSHSDTYVRLQQVFKAKADADVLAMGSILKDMGHSVEAHELALFCKNVRNIRFCSTRSLDQERSEPLEDAVVDAADDPYADAPEQTPMCWYLTLRGAERFRGREGRYPGSDDAQLTADGEALWKDTVAVSESYVEMGEGLDGMLKPAHAEEVTRYGGVEIHTTASFIGGVASQEAVKLITRQYIPLNNTFVYNGIAGVGGAYEL